MCTRNVIHNALIDFGGAPRPLPSVVRAAARCRLVIYDVDVGVSFEPPVEPGEKTDHDAVMSAIEAIAARPAATVVVPAVDLAGFERLCERLADSLETTLARAVEAGQHSQSGKPEQAR